MYIKDKKVRSLRGGATQTPMHKSLIPGKLLEETELYDSPSQAFKEKRIYLNSVFTTLKNSPYANPSKNIVVPKGVKIQNRINLINSSLYANSIFLSSGNTKKIQRTEELIFVIGDDSCPIFFEIAKDENPSITTFEENGIKCARVSFKEKPTNYTQEIYKNSPIIALTPTKYQKLATCALTANQTNKPVNLLDIYNNQIENELAKKDQKDYAKELSSYIKKNQRSNDTLSYFYKTSVENKDKSISTAYTQFEPAAVITYTGNKKTEVLVDNNFTGDFKPVHIDNDTTYSVPLGDIEICK